MRELFLFSRHINIGISCRFWSLSLCCTLLLGMFYCKELCLTFCDLCLVFQLETGKVILESVILTTVVVVSLTLYTFWAARRGHDFNFLGPFLFGAVMVLMVFAIIQVC
jgi:FtsH-binding integral membrane protein